VHSCGRSYIPVDSTSWVDVSRVACPPIRVVQVLGLIRTPTRKHLTPQAASSKNGIDLLSCRLVSIRASVD
jgi:hypothetical protein